MDAIIRLALLAAGAAAIWFGGRWLADRRGQRPPGMVWAKPRMAITGLFAATATPVFATFLLIPLPGWDVNWGWILPAATAAIALHQLAHVFRYRLVCSEHGITERRAFGRATQIPWSEVELWEVQSENTVCLKPRTGRTVAVSTMFHDGVDELAEALAARGVPHA